ncbi:MAG: glycosyltransferase family 2 protein, partial [Dehalococcoidia bacterium]
MPAHPEGGAGIAHERLLVVRPVRRLTMCRGPLPRAASAPRGVPRSRGRRDAVATPMPDAPRPLLSFAIPTYQHGHALPQALESILTSPRAAEVEIVISNNASTDDTAEVIERFTSRYANVRGLNQASTVTFDENLARAMDACTGRYIWTMSSDDVLTEDALSHVLDVLGGLERDTILLGNWWIADGDLRPTHLRRAVHARS